MKICIGIFAHNEEDGIKKTIQDLFSQDLITSCVERKKEIEIICIPNGCTDNTAQISKMAISDCIKAIGNPSPISWKVDELSLANKANAWNYFIHCASKADTEYFICLDADIAIPQRECLSRIIETLDAKPEAYVVVDEPIKDIVVKQTSGFMSWLNRTITRGKLETRRQGRFAIAGSLFCGRSQVFRKIFLPKGLVRVDDGFIKAMVITNCFTTHEQFHRLVLAEGCYHIFYAYNTFLSLFKHNRNQLVGTVVNAVIYDFLWKNSNPEKAAGDIIKELNETKPDWLYLLLKIKLTRSVRLKTIGEIVLDPIKRSWNPSNRGSFRNCAISLLQTLLSIPVAIAANSHLKKSKFVW